MQPSVSQIEAKWMSFQLVGILALGLQVWLIDTGDCTLTVAIKVFWTQLGITLTSKSGSQDCIVGGCVATYSTVQLQLHTRVICTSRVVPRVFQRGEKNNHVCAYKFTHLHKTHLIPTRVVFMRESHIFSLVDV